VTVASDTDSLPVMPLMIYDGDCNFCKFWIIRWQRATEGRVEYAPSQDPRIAEAFPEIPREQFNEAVQFVESDGKIYSGAEAVFRSLTYSRWWAWTFFLYDRVAGVKPVTEGLYKFVARRREFFSSLTRLLWGREGASPEYTRVRWIFLRLLGLIYLAAFVSLGTQVTGLIGSNGILPAEKYMTAAQAQLDREHIGFERYQILPTLCWFSASDKFLEGLCIAGAAISVLLIVNVAPAACLFLTWLIYLSLMCVGEDFLSFQWDALLLETGLLAIFFAPLHIFPSRKKSSPPSRAILWLLRWLLFRLMFESGVVKLINHDANWRNLGALRFHYETQPLPTWIGWYAHQLPGWFQTASVFLMFVIELAVPFLIFAPRRLRFIGCGILILLQVAIFLTGNYCFFNLLTMALCIALLDDAFISRFLPKRWRAGKISASETSPPDGKALQEIVVPAGPSLPPANARRWPGWATGICLAVVLVITVPQVVGMLTQTQIWFPPGAVAEGLLSPFRSINTYGLFAVMTTERREIVIEGSSDGQTWLPYEFKYKPGDPARRPRFVAPLQPRLDWQMWFAALGNYDDNRWFSNCCLRLLQGSRDVTGLFKHNPFPVTPPRYIRALVYDYHFTTPQERRATGNWWTRKLIGEYMPEISLREKQTH
jgi:predicted DCC family thiol-disulfide oxidoreductase YuxK